MRKISTTAVCCIIVLILPSLVGATVYKWRDTNGDTVYGDTPPEHIKKSEIQRIEIKDISKKITPVVNATATETDTQETNTQTHKEHNDRTHTHAQNKELVAYCTEIRQKITRLRANLRQIAASAVNGTHDEHQHKIINTRIEKARNTLRKKC